MPNIRNALSGFILIEVMLASALSLFLLSLLMSMYLLNQQHTQQLFALYQHQENARSAINILTNEIRKAGYLGCAYLTQDFPVKSSDGEILARDNKLIGYANGFIEIRYMEFPSSDVIAPMSSLSEIVLNSTVQYKKNDVLVIADCSKAEVFKVKQVLLIDGKQRLQTQHPLHDYYRAYAEVGRLQHNTFYIAPTNQHRSNGEVIYALMMKDRHQHPVELVEDMLDWQLRYTLYQQGRWLSLPAEQIMQWQQVQGVSIDMQVGGLPVAKHWHAYIPLNRVMV